MNHNHYTGHTTTHITHIYLNKVLVLLRFSPSPSPMYKSPISILNWFEILTQSLRQLKLFKLFTNCLLVLKYICSKWETC